MHFITDSLKDRLLFAIPKKGAQAFADLRTKARSTDDGTGRLYEKCLELLQGADVQFTRSHRLDVCLVRNHPIALSAPSSVLCDQVKS